jgi:hypothetical protein
MKLTNYQILQETRRILSSPECWTRGTGAKDKDGEKVHVCDEKAQCFCIIGAICRAFHNLSHGKYCLDWHQYDEGNTEIRVFTDLLRGKLTVLGSDIYNYGYRAVLWSFNDNAKNLQEIQAFLDFVAKEPEFQPEN